MDTIVEPVGSFGNFQKINLGIVGCVTMLSGMYYNLNILVNTFEPNMDCKIRHGMENTSEFGDISDYSTCDMWDSYRDSSSSNSPTPFICKVDNSSYGLNVALEWNLICRNKYLATITQSLYLIGTLCAFIIELVVGKYGRRKTSVIFILALITAGIVSQTLISDIKMLSVKDHQIRFIIFAAFQPIIGILVHCLSGSTYMHLIELTTNNYHRLFSNLNVLFYFLGEIACLAIYFFVQSWKLTSWFFVLFAILTFAMFNFFVLESPRWLIETAQYEEAYEILKKIARFNKKKTLDSPKFKDYLLKQMQSNISDRSRESSDLEDQLDNLNKPKMEIKDITFTHRVCVPKSNFVKISLFILFFNCMSINFFGVSISIVNVTQINKLLIVALSSVSGLLGALVCVFNEKTGYKSAILNFLIISGLTSLLVVLIPDQEQINWIVISKISFGVLGKAAIVAAYNTGIIFAAESYDRKIKMNLIFLLNCAGCVMTIATPQINFLSIIWKPLPYVIYTVTAMVSFIVINNLPEPRSLQKKKNLDYM